MRHVKIVRSNRPVTQRFQLRPLFFRRSWSITTLIGSIAAMTTLAGILLHGCGHVAYTSYLDKWGVQADLFPQSADWKVIRGYYALVFQGARIIKSVPWFALAISVLLLTIPIWLYRLPARPKSRPYKPFIEKRPLAARIAFIYCDFCSCGLFDLDRLFRCVAYRHHSRTHWRARRS